MMRPRDLLKRWPSLLTAPLGAFSAVTLCWCYWGLTTPGDYFANGNPWVDVSLKVALLVGAVLAYLAGRWLRVVVVAISVMCAAFWIFVPDGWWVTPPPHMHSSQ